VECSQIFYIHTMNFRGFKIMWSSPYKEILGVKFVGSKNSANFVILLKYRKFQSDRNFAPKFSVYLGRSFFNSNLAAYQILLTTAVTVSYIIISESLVPKQKFLLDYNIRRRIEGKQLWSVNEIWGLLQNDISTLNFRTDGPYKDRVDIF